MNPIDISIIAIYLLLIFSIGIYTKNYISDFSDFMIAGRNINLPLAVVTMLGTELGLITVMYNAQTGVIGLFSSFHIGAISLLATLFIGLTGIVIVKLRSLNIKSIPEFYEYRFNKKVRIIGAILLSLGGILNMGLFLKVGAIFIQSIFGVSSDSNILMLIMFLLLVLVLFYTMFGGMMSVVITDYIQYIVLSIGFIVSIIFSFKTLGWSNIFTTLESIYDYEKIYNPIKSHGLYYISWQTILGFVSAVIWPTAITRALAIKHVDLVQKQYLWSSISFLIRFIIPSFLGICAVVYFSTAVGDNTLALFPKYLSDILPVGFFGLVVAGMLAAFMSTHDSYLLCWSTIITNDIIEPLYGKELSSNFKIKITRIIIVLLGIYIFYWGMFYNGSDSIWDYLGITGAIYFTGAIVVILFGLYWKKASSNGAFLALIGGLSCLLGLEPIREYFSIPINNPALIGLISLGISCSLMIIGSIISPDKSKHRILLPKVKEFNFIRKYYIGEFLTILILIISYMLYGPNKYFFYKIFSWKLFWQFLLIISIILFIFMFLKFSYSGLRDIKTMLQKDNRYE